MQKLSNNTPPFCAFRPDTSLGVPPSESAINPGGELDLIDSDLDSQNADSGMYVKDYNGVC